MDESVKSEARLDVSVSFGRFENDALSWEKFSAFSPNKYLEEVGTLSTPGSVAQKKAYFEAHYKKIAAKKAEELEQENSTDSANPSSNASSKEDHVEDSYEADSKFCSSNGDRLAEEADEEACISSVENVTISDETEVSSREDRVEVSSELHSKFSSSNGERFAEQVEEEACISSLENVTTADETKDDNARSSEGLEEEVFTNGSIDVIPSEVEKEEVKDGPNDNLVNPALNVNEESALVGVEIPNNDARKIMAKPRERKNGVVQLKKENPKLTARNIAQKVTPTKKDSRSSDPKKKIISPSVKSSQASTPRYSKPSSISTPISASQSLKKKVNGSPLPKSKNPVAGQSKKSVPTSLHMSISLGHSTPAANLSMTRKSLIMEQMGDKDIVKRAFKTFQNRTIGSYSDEKPNIAKTVPSSASEPKNSTFRTPVKGSEGLRKDAQKTTTPRSQSGPRSTPFPSSGSSKISIRDRKNTPAFSQPIALKSDEKSENRKEFLKKLEAKSIAREAEKARLNAKPRDDKKTEIKKLSQSYNSSAKPKSPFSQGRAKAI